MQKETVLTAMDFAAFYKAELGELRQGTNGNYLGLCPFHQDTEPSISVNLQSPGLYLCFACDARGDIFDFYMKKHGCGFKEALAALARFAGLDVGALAKSKRPGKIVATYDYLDARGEVLFQVVRLEPKTFRQRRPDGNGGYIWNLQGIEPVLYHLPEVLEAEQIFICEGEKDADRLAALSLTATCNPMGAGKWRGEYGRHLQSKQVAILPDNDPQGRDHARTVARALHGTAASVKVVELPGLPAKGDVSDWLEAGGTIERLLDLVEKGMEYVPEDQAQAQAKELASEFGYTDMGNAARLVALHGRDLRYSYKWGSWLVWDGMRWLKDDGGEIERRAKDVARSIYAEASRVEDKDLRKAIADHAKKTEGEGKRRAMIASAQCELPVSLENLDRDPWLLSVLNGTLNLKTGELQPHRREDFITKLAPVAYDSSAEAPIWWAFLQRTMDGNLDLITFLQKAVGYALTGSTREQCLFILYGLGENGKTTFLETIKELLGDYAADTSTETFMFKKHPTIPNDIAALRGARFVKAVEVEGGRRMAEVLVKQMTGGDTMSARFLHQEWFSFRPHFKIFLGVNHKPVIRATDWAIWRRIRLIPFTVQILKAEQDKDLPEKLKAELPGIMIWALEGCLNWQDYGMDPPADVEKATKDYREEMDVLGDWLAECCIIHPSASSLARDLYNSYTKWAEENGEKRPLSQRAFGGSLTERGFYKKRSGSTGSFVWFGLGLSTE